MTVSDTRETVAFAMWKHEALRAALNVGRKRTAEDFAGASDAERSKWLGLADAAIAAIPAVHVGVKPLRYVDPEGETLDQMREHARQHPLARKGDMKLVWINEGDLYNHSISALTTQPSPDVAAQFDSADWYWRTMDPDDCGDNPAEAINRGMVGLYCVCEIASSFTGPTRYGFLAPVLDPESDDEEFVHFGTQQEAMEAAKARAALARVKGGAA